MITEPEISSLVLRMRARSAEHKKTETLANRIGVTPETLIRRFKKYTGVSPSRFQAALRLAAAADLLLNSNLSVTTICFEVGYSSLGTFITSFSESIGLSPSKYRSLSRELPLDEILAACLSWSTKPTGSQLRITGLITNVNVADRLSFFGIFSHGLPSGLPVTGTVVMGREHFELHCPEHSGELNLLGLSIPFPRDVRELWNPDPKDVLVFAKRLHKPQFQTAHIIHLTVSLRSLLPSDPPLVVPIPILLGLHDRQSGRSIAAISDV